MRKTNKKGFTLVECIVAMAVLAIMSLLLTMILAVALKSRDQNMAIEKSIDEQLEKIAANGAGAVTEDCNSGIKLKNGGWSETIPGNSASGVTANKKYYDNENSRIGFLDYDFSGFNFASAGGVGAVPEPGDDTETHKYKSFGTAKLDAATRINITDNTNPTKSESEFFGISKNSDNTFTVTWTIKTKFTEIAPERALMLRLPTGASEIKRISISDKYDLYVIEKDVIRIGCTKDAPTNDIIAKISFKLSEEKLKEYKNVAVYFGNPGAVTNNVIIDYGIEA